MSIAMKAGARYKSAVCDSQVMIIKAPAGERALNCGGVEMIAMTASPSADVALTDAGGTVVGKRYVNADESVELLCVKAGKGRLVLDGVPLEIKQAKQLPSSD